MARPLEKRHESPDGEKPLYVEDILDVDAAIVRRLVDGDLDFVIMLDG
jgi:hypothetical protein